MDCGARPWSARCAANEHRRCSVTGGSECQRVSKMCGNASSLHHMLKLLDPPENSAELLAPLRQHPVGLWIEEEVDQAGWHRCGLVVGRRHL